MNNQEKHIDDNLKKFVGPEMSEKAPEGFTSKVMTRIQMMPVSEKTDRVVLKRSLVPYVSAAVILILITASYILQGVDTSPQSPTIFTNMLNNINLSLPKVNLSSLFRIKFPEFLSYIFFGLFFLALFDRGLYKLFHRRKSH